MSVLLPAPFSPTSAWRVPGRTRRVTPWLARTAPKRLWMPSISTAHTLGWAEAVGWDGASALMRR